MLFKMTFSGAHRLRLDQRGDMILSTDGGEVRQRKPVLYQQIDGGRKIVEGRYVIKGRRTVGFQVGRYDKTKPLVIDPVLVYSTFLGGSNSFNGGDFSGDIAVDGAGNAYVIGTTTSTDFPTKDAYKSTGTYRDAFVTKIDPAGALVYSTYFGGGPHYGNSGGTHGYGIAVDGAGNAYLTGETSAVGFPTVNAFRSTINGQDSFVSKLNASGNALIYSTFLGGGYGGDFARAIAVDGNGSAYITGSTGSADFPTKNALQPTISIGDYGRPSQDAFVTKLTAAGNALMYSTFLGGNSPYGGVAQTVAWTSQLTKRATLTSSAAPVRRTFRSRIPYPDKTS